MNFGTHTIIVGIIYILAGIAFAIKSRNNVFDKGFAWVFFALFHGIDEVVDGMIQVGVLSSIDIWLERIEYTTFFLSSSFLLIATFVKINRLRYSEIMAVGFAIQLPSILFFMTLDEAYIHVLETLGITIFGTKVLYFTLIFGLLPTLPLIILLLYQFFSTIGKSHISSTQRYGFVLTSIMLIIYNIGEMFTDVSLIFLYSEVFAIIIILMIPLEFNLGREQQLQLHLIYSVDGSPILITKFNTNLSEDILILVSGLLSAINTLVEQELDLGALEQVDTGKGSVVVQHKGDLIHAILVNEIKPEILEKFHSLVTSVDEYFNTEKDLNLQYFTMDQRSKLQELVYSGMK